MVIPRLPPELYELIVDEITAENVQTLRSCCLAALVFRHPCQKRLFSTIRAEPNSNINSFSAIARKLDLNPRISSYCNTLDVVLPVTRARWEQEKMAADGVLQRLTNVRAGLISQIYELAVTANARMLIAPMVEMVVASLQAHGKLKKLRLNRLVLTPHALARSLVAAPHVSLHKIALHYPTEVDPPASEPPAFPPPSANPLTKLEIYGPGPYGNSDMHSLLCALLGRPDFKPHLQSVQQLKSEVDCQQNLTPCFAAASTLRRLDCQFFHLVEERVVFPDCLPRLCELNIDVSSHYVPSFLPRLLSRGSLPALIDLRIRLGLVPENLRVMNDELRISPPSQVSELDDALDVHPTVKMVEVSLTLDCGSDEEDDDTEDNRLEALHRLAELLSKARSRGLIVVQEERF